MKAEFRKKISIIMTLSVLILGTCGLIPIKEVSADTPRLMVSDYSIDKEKIYPGDTFKITFTLKNNALNRVSNIKCKISSDNGQFLPVNSPGTAYIDEIYGEEEETLSFTLKADKGLKENAYKITIKTEYENWNGSYENVDEIYIPVSYEARAKIYGAYIIEEDIRLGDNIEIVASVNNIGNSDIYNVEAVCKGDNITQTDQFFGTIEVGKSANIDLITKTIALGRGDRINKLYVNYEDKDGNKYTDEYRLGVSGVINVMEQDYSDIITVKEGPEKKGEGTWYGIIFGIVVLCIVLFFIVRRIKYKRRISKEFE